MKILILAAGKGSRMKSSTPKVLMEIASKSMIQYTLELAYSLNPDDVYVVVGDHTEILSNWLAEKYPQVKLCFQKVPNGTAAAVMTLNQQMDLKNSNDKILILCADMPLIRKETIDLFLLESKNKSSSFISTIKNDPRGYGRVIRDINNNFTSIKEDKDASDEEKSIKEINTGVYLCTASVLYGKLIGVKNNNAQGEYYLTDIVDKDFFVWKAVSEKEFTGINDRVQLAEAAKFLFKELSIKLMLDGVTIIDPSSFYPSHDLKVGQDTIIYPNVFFEGKVVIGKNCKIYPGVRISNSVIHDNVEIKDNTVIESSIIGSDSTVGPSANLRKGTILKGQNRIGNFVETKNAVIGEKTKASHLTYLGDCKIGKQVNIGCGVITANYDGNNKYETTVGDNVFIGCDTQLIAPVCLEKGSFVAAGSTITKNVPENGFAIARSKQVNLEKKK